MATPPSAVAAEMFQGEAARATAALQRAIRAARRAAQVGRGLDDPAPPKPVDWENLSASAWEHHGALSAFRMKVQGRYTSRRGGTWWLREATVDDTTMMLVQLLEIAEGAVVQLPVMYNNC
eukprot:3164586-Pleurochrysis_carterae.AAC.1